jgi:3-oxoacyl-[acyl-carrier-protein] synthase II
LAKREIIKRGDAIAMITGGSEAPITEFALAAFHRTQAMSTRNDDPARASFPLMLSAMALSSAKAQV